MAREGTALSLAMIVPATRQAVCNKLMLALGRGPDTFGVAVRDKVTLAIVAYAAHSYDDELAACLQAQTLPDDVTLADLQAQGFTAATARTAASYIRVRLWPRRTARANLVAALDAQGWELVPPPSPVA